VLAGVTGSGKTEVYLRAIETVAASGKTALVLVPEISLTPQTLGRFRSRFGEQVAVLHSRLSAGERFDQWDMIRSGFSRVVVGARSALFAPLENLGLIVIDEEHDGSYKNHSSVRYHVREVAEKLCELATAKLILGTATPSMEALHRAETGRYGLVTLPERVGQSVLPPVKVVDLSSEFSAGNRSMFSHALLGALRTVHEKGEKALLFLNRRGFAQFLLCRECGYVPRCTSCSTSLTYHATQHKLRCHQCNALQTVPTTCPVCGSPYLRQFGAGTQRIESELRQQFPQWPLVRMDADTTSGKGAHARLLHRFEEMDTGVLLGTQMVAKGLDFPDVTLVGVITADITLNLPDFRAGERTFQLLEQVAGRAGRGERGGQVIVQTYWPQHRAVAAAAAHDPALFFAEERLERVELAYPPYGALANVVIFGRDQNATLQYGQTLAKNLRMPDAFTEQVQVLGPAPCALQRSHGQWRYHILLKAAADMIIGPDLLAVLNRTPKPKGGDIKLSVDVDPIDLM
jgi:primosomal protein N' (replication factor Y)